MRRMLCMAAAALAFLPPAALAEARVHVYARTKCVGLYCRIVSEPQAWLSGHDPQKARVDFKNVLELNPSDADASKAIEQITKEFGGR